MITGLISSFLLATVILMPKNGKVIDTASTPAPTPEQELIFEEPVRILKEGEIEPKVVLKKIDKRKKVAKIKKIKTGNSITIGPPDENLEEDIEDILNKEQEYFKKEESRREAPARTAASIDENLNSFNKIEKKYKTTFMSMDVSKQVTQALLDKTRSSSGELWMAPQGLLRLEIKDPEQSLLVMDGKNIWVVDYPVDGMQNKVQILRGKVNKSLKNQAFLGFLMGQEDILSVFNIEETITDASLTTYKLKPKKNDQDVQKLEIQMDSTKELINRISYWDQLGNKTQLEFSHQKERSEVPKDKFEFKPPKDSEVTEL